MSHRCRRLIAAAALLAVLAAGAARAASPAAERPGRLAAPGPHPEIGGPAAAVPPPRWRNASASLRAVRWPSAFTLAAFDVLAALWPPAAARVEPPAAARVEPPPLPPLTCVHVDAGNQMDPNGGCR